MRDVRRPILTLGCLLAAACGGDRGTGPSQLDLAARLDSLARANPLAGSSLATASDAVSAGAAVTRVTVSGDGPAGGSYDGVASDIVRRMVGSTVFDSSFTLVAWRGTNPVEVLVVMQFGPFTDVAQSGAVARAMAPRAASGGAFPASWAETSTDSSLSGAFSMAFYMKGREMWMGGTLGGLSFEAQPAEGSAAFALQSTGESCPTPAGNGGEWIRILSCQAASISAAFDLELAPFSMYAQGSTGPGVPSDTSARMRLQLGSATLGGIRLVEEMTAPPPLGF